MADTRFTWCLIRRFIDGTAASLALSGLRFRSCRIRVRDSILERSVVTRSLYITDHFGGFARFADNEDPFESRYRKRRFFFLRCLVQSLNVAISSKGEMYSRKYNWNSRGSWRRIWREERARVNAPDLVRFHQINLHTQDSRPYTRQLAIMANNIFVQAVISVRFVRFQKEKMLSGIFPACLIIANLIRWWVHQSILVK